MARQLRSRSRSSERQYTDAEEDEQQRQENLMDEFHRNKSGKKHIVVRAFGDGKVRVVDFTKNKSLHSSLKLVEEEYATSAYEEEFAVGNLVAAYFGKTARTSASFYKCHIVGMFDNSKEALQLYRDLSKSKGTKAPVKTTQYQSVQRLQSILQATAATTGDEYIPTMHLRLTFKLSLDLQAFKASINSKLNVTNKRKLAKRPISMDPQGGAKSKRKNVNRLSGDNDIH